MAKSKKGPRILFVTPEISYVSKRLSVAIHPFSETLSHIGYRGSDFVFIHHPSGPAVSRK